MQSLSDLERAVLAAIVDQVPEWGEALRQQVMSATVTERENTGAGFYTKLAVTGGQKLVGVTSPIGDVGADIEAMSRGMGFLLWMKDGVADTLEGYTYDDTTAGLELTALRFRSVGPRSV
ncbi:MAG TPA: hypothetical protein VGG92_17700 [Caulobacteraceae bacterium]|jgi:hypothetical protein